MSRVDHGVKPGQEYDRLTTVRIEKHRNENLWYCECSCGGHTWARAMDLVKGRKRGCVCLRREAATAYNAARGVKAEDRFDQLYVERVFVVGNGRDAERYADCLCDCGRRKTIRCGDLRSKASRTCGHGVADAARARAEAMGVKVGDTYDRWTVLETYVVGEKGSERRVARCECRCGTLAVVDCHNLKSGAIRSCTCYQREAQRAHFSEKGVLPGLRYGLLVVREIYFTGGERSNRRAICDCDCGREKDVVAGSLVQKLTISCGCEGLLRMKAGRRLKIRQDRMARNLHPDRPISGFNRALWDIFRRPSQVINARDRYTCQLCGRRGGHLHVHHIVKKSHLDRFLDPGNLVTLCRMCHLVAHDQKTRKAPNPRLAKILGECALWANLDAPPDYDRPGCEARVAALRFLFKTPEAS